MNLDLFIYWTYVNTVRVIKFIEFNFKKKEGSCGGEFKQ